MIVRLILSILKVTRFPNSLVTNKSTRFSRIRYFHPKGENMKDGVYVYKGFFYWDCCKNARSFRLNPQLHKNFNEAKKCKGGIIILPEVQDVSHEILLQKVEVFFSAISKEMGNNLIFKIFYWSKINYFENIGNQFEVNNIFTGNYISPSGHKFGIRSMTIEIIGLRHKELLRLAAYIYEEFKLECIVVNDFNKNKYYYVENNFRN